MNVYKKIVLTILLAGSVAPLAAMEQADCCLFPPTAPVEWPVFVKNPFKIGETVVGNLQASGPHYMNFLKSFGLGASRFNLGLAQGLNYWTSLGAHHPIASVIFGSAVGYSLYRVYKKFNTIRRRR